MKIGFRVLILLAGALLLLGAAGCGEKEEPDEQSTRVIRITITPPPTATPVPITNFPKALEEKNGVIFVNQYLIDQETKGR